MVIDIDKCTGCGACMVACQAENNVAPAVDGSNKLRSLNWLTVFRLSNQALPRSRSGLSAPALHAVRQALLRVRVPGHCHGQA